MALEYDGARYQVFRADLCAGGPTVHRWGSDAQSASGIHQLARGHATRSAAGQHLLAPTEGRLRVVGFRGHGHVPLTPGARLAHPPFGFHRHGFIPDGFNGGSLNGPIGYPYFIPSYGYDYPYYDVATEPSESLPGAGTFDRPDSEEQPDYEPGGPTVFERRPRGSPREEDRYGDHYLDEREQRPAPATAPAPVAPAPSAAEESISTVLVFRDGHRLEVRNYAIMGHTVYLFSGERRKLPLEELDLEATRKLNDERGVEFIIPEGQ